MRGPIDYIVVAFDGNNFNGEILDALNVAMDNGTIDVLDLALISKDEDGEVSSVEMTNIESDVIKALAVKKGPAGALITEEDVEEAGELLENNTSAGLLIIEQLWAIDLKRAIGNANGTLIAEGRIHPDAQNELDI